MSPHATVAERTEGGKAARRIAPRSSHADWTPAPDRPDPITLLEEQAAQRVAELVPIRHGRMLVSPFAFFRGAALIMAADLAPTPTSSIDVQICGDAHLSNFGLFGSPERRLVFDINDFDETLPGPWEWDVKRLAASFAIAGRDMGLSRRQRDAAVGDVLFTYRQAMRRFATQRSLDVWYAHMDADELLASMRNELTAGQQARTAAALAKARTKDSTRALSKLTHIVDGQRRIISDPPLIVPIEDLEPDADGADLEDLWRGLFQTYRRTLAPERRALLEQFRAVHVARKVVGVGSVGTRVWIVLLTGRDEDDPLFLQIKEAQPSVLERFLAPSAHETAGERVVAGQKLMQAASDVFLGWDRLDRYPGAGPRDFYVRQLHDWKGGAEVDRMRPKGLAAYGRLCGWTLARAHARSGDRIAIAAYLGSGDAFDRAVCDFAEAYADQNEVDYAALQEAVRSGRLEAVSGL